MADDRQEDIYDDELDVQADEFKAQREQELEDEAVALGIDERHVMGALAYVGPLVVVPFLMMRDDSFVWWHVKQGAILLVLLVIFLFFHALLGVLGSFLLFVLMLVTIVALIQALNGRTWRIPGIATLVDQLPK